MLTTRTGKDLILATRDFASENNLRSWWSILSTLFLLVLALAGTVWNFNIVLRLVCSVLSGMLILRFFVIYHDQQHSSILPNSKLASSLMKVFGVLVLSPSSIWKTSHNYHHKHNSKLRSANIGSFPIMTKTKFLSLSKRQQRKYLFVRHPLTILFGYIFTFIYGMCWKPFWSYPRRHLDSLLALSFHFGLGIFLVLHFGWETLVLSLVLPCFMAHAIGTYLFYAQHNFPEVTFSDHKGWTYEKAAMESSSYLKMGNVMQWFTANIGFHHVHHLNAKIPFYRLPEAMKKIPELQMPKTTTLNPVEIRKCLRLKVWDVESQRMTPLPN